MKNSLKYQETTGYTIENLLDYLYHQKYQKLIGMDLTRQADTIITQQFNFVVKLGKDDGATMFLLINRSKNLF